MSFFKKSPNAHYWEGSKERSTVAMEHKKDMEVRFKDEIAESIQKTKVYDTDFKYDRPLNFSINESNVIQNTTDGALFELEDNGKKTALLNFASYKNPGGAFLTGSKAQEECLCHTSTLFNVISEQKDYYEWNKQHLNRGLYLNRALYSPDIIFEDKNGKAYKCDVITCASPNRSIALSALITNSKGFSEEENEKVLLDRINYVRDICLNEGVERVILGAWGCGVFQQIPSVVAQGFQNAFYGTGIECIYAIPDEKTYKPFKEVFDKPLIKGEISEEFAQQLLSASNTHSNRMNGGLEKEIENER